MRDTFTNKNLAIIRHATKNFLSKNRKFAKFEDDIVRHFFYQFDMNEWTSAENAKKFFDKCFIALSPFALLRNLVGDEEAVDSVLATGYNYVKYRNATERQKVLLRKEADSVDFYDISLRLISEYMQEKMLHLGVEKEETSCTFYEINHVYESGRNRHFFILHQKF